MPTGVSGSLVPKRTWGNFGNFLPFFQVDFMPKMIVQMLSLLPFASAEFDSEREEL